MLYRYLFRETMLPFIFITGILTVMFITAEMANIITLVIEGRYEQAAAYKVIGMYIPMLLPDIIPPAYFLAILMTFNRLAQDNERTIILATGRSEGDILKRLLVTTALPVTAVLAVITLWLSPKYHFEFETYRVAQQNRPLTTLIEAGKFYALPNGQGLILARQSDPKTGQLGDVTSIRTSNREEQILTARSAQLVAEEDTYLVFQEGKVVQLPNDQSYTAQQQFERYAIKLPTNDSEYDNLKLSGMSTASLIATSSQWRRSELSERIIYPFIIPVLCIWALGLTQSRPRQSKVGAIALGIALYIVYSFLTRTVHAAITTGKVPLWADFWWMHLLAAITGLLLFYRRQTR